MPASSLNTLIRVLLLSSLRDLSAGYTEGIFQALRCNRDVIGLYDIGSDCQRYMCVSKLSTLIDSTVDGIVYHFV